MAGRTSSNPSGGTIRGMAGTSRTPAAIAVGLRALGVKRGDLLMVHASLRALGPIDRGADGLIDAIRQAIGGTGTMQMVLGAHDDHAWVNERPEAERPALLRDAQPFDARRTPAARDVGALAEVFRQRPETNVSDHPEARFGAAGPLAERLTADVPWDDYFGPGSPLERLITDGGKVLRLGADLDTVTALHHAEYLCAVAPKRRVRRHRLVQAGSGAAEIRVVECLDDEEGIVDYQGEDYLEGILRDYLATGRASVGMVGDARSELLDAADVVAFGVRWMDEHLRQAHDGLTLEELSARLDADLRDAQRRRSRYEVTAVRSLKSALANAGSVPVEERPFELVEGSAHVPRRELDAAHVRAVVQAEVEERQRAAAEYQDLAADTTALESELATLLRYLGPA